MKRIALLALAATALLAASSNVVSAAVDSDERVAIVRKLYHAYRSEAGLGIDGPLTFIAESQARLERYLTPSLALLIVREQACRRQTRRYCRVDFAPLWDAEIPVRPQIDIQGLAPDGTVHVRVSYGPRKHAIMIFVLQKTDAGWRIDDFGTANWSLRKLLDPPASTNGESAPVLGVAYPYTPMSSSISNR